MHPLCSLPFYTMPTLEYYNDVIPANPHAPIDERTGDTSLK